MAAGILSAPGTGAGPCLEPCSHTDCAASREWAERACSICSEPIGFEVRFYRTGPDRELLAHAACLERSLELEA